MILDDRAALEQAQADGQISVEDADTVREFAAFLREFGPASDTSPGSADRRRRALIDHAELCGLTDADVAHLRAAEGA